MNAYPVYISSCSCEKWNSFYCWEREKMNFPRTTPTLHVVCILNVLMHETYSLNCIAAHAFQLNWCNKKKKKKKNYWTLQMLTLMTDASILLFKSVQWNKYYKYKLYSVLRSSCCKTRISCIQKFIPTETCNFNVEYWQPIKRYDSLNYT